MKILSVHIVLLFLLAFNANAQTDNEGDIKKNCFWEHAYHEIEEEAKKLSLDLLWKNSSLNKEMAAGKIYDKTKVQYFGKKLEGGRYKVIAFIPKKEYTETIPEPIVTAVNKPIVPVPTPTPIPPPKPVDTPTKANVEASSAQLGNILGGVFLAEDCYALEKKLFKMKRQNLLMYSNRENAFNTSECYIVICDNQTAKIKMVLDKGHSERKNLLNNQKYSLRDLFSEGTPLYIFEVKQ
jgi:hypothetical protein